jgi:hypothetical protein
MLAPYIYNELKTFLKTTKGNFLEIGSFDGDGIAMLAKLYPEKMFYSIDPFIEDGHTTHITNTMQGNEIEHIYQRFKANTDNLTNIVHFKMPTARFLELKLMLPSINTMLIDGDHSFFGASLDLQLANILAKNNELTVFMDDINKKSVRGALNYFNANYGFLIEPTLSIDLIKFKLKL